MNLTPNQLRAVTTTGGEILVSAGAGSGKTSVLARRCAHLVADAPQRCRIDQLLVVTFTESAAVEMRDRIGRVLRERLAATPADAWIRRQLLLLDLAPISTIHAFCRRTLARHYLAAGVDPGFSVMDEQESAALRDDVLDRLLRERRLGDGPLTEQYEQLLRLYAGGYDGSLKERIVDLHSFMESLPDPENWAAAVLAQYADAAADKLSVAWSRARSEHLQGRLTEHVAAGAQVVEEFAARPGAEPVVKPLHEYIAALTGELARLRAMTNDSAIDAVCGAIAQLPALKLPVRTKKVQSLPSDQLAGFDDSIAAARAWRDHFKSSLQECDAAHTAADWAEGLARVRPHLAALFDLTAAFREQFAAARQRLGRMDFADLERFTLRLLRSSPATVTALRAEYEHVLVDEYQDVNPLQDELLRCIARLAPTGEASNLFCVGDVKQSIYRFRMAEPELFVRRWQALESSGPSRGACIDLPDNFRSRPAVLAAVNRVMSRLMTADFGLVDYDERSKLRGGVSADVPEPPASPVELHLLLDRSSRADPDEAGNADAVAEDATDQSRLQSGESPHLDLERIEVEALQLADRMHALRAAEPSLAWRDMAVLLRSPGPRLDFLLNRLTSMGVPVFTDRGGGLFGVLAVRDLRAVLALLDNAQQDIPLAALLRSPFCTTVAGLHALPLSDGQLLRVRAHTRGVPFHAAVRAYAGAGPDVPLRDALRSVLDRIAAWRHAARCLTVPELISLIYRETAALDLDGGPAGADGRAVALLAIHDAARRFAGFARQGLHRFVRYLDEMEARDEELRSPPSPGAADVVRVMSIHQAKGLEFPFVFLIDAGRRFNLNDARQAVILDRRLGPALKAVDEDRWITYPTLAHRLASARIRDESRSEELRLLYVALTRAKRRLFIYGTAGRRAAAALERPQARPDGPLPLARRRSAATMLDWLADVVAAEPPSSPPLFQVFTHAADEVPAAQRPVAPLSTADGWMQRAARLEPLPKEWTPAIDDVVRERRAVERLSADYSAAPLTEVASVVAASELKRRWLQHADPELPAESITAQRRHAPTQGRIWRRPRFATDGAAPLPTERGTWTHLLLQHLDLSRPCDLHDLRAQLKALSERLRLAPDQLAAIDIESIAWFFTEPPGRELRDARDRLLRETPFVLSVSPHRYDPAAAARDGGDFLVVRGVIDCLYSTAEGWVVLDWKTDTVGAAGLAERITTYTPQLDIYAQAATELLREPVYRRRLVFLAARHVADV